MGGDASKEPSTTNSPSSTSPFPHSILTASTATEQSFTTRGTDSVIYTTHVATSIRSTDYGVITSDVLSTTSEWLSHTSTNGRTAHEPTDSENVSKTQSFEDSTNIDTVTGSATLDPKIIAGIAAAGIVLLLLVLMFVIAKRRHHNNTNLDQQTIAEEKDNVLYEMNATYTEENGGRNLGAYPTTIYVTNEVGDSKNRASTLTQMKMIVTIQHSEF